MAADRRDATAHAHAGDGRVMTPRLDLAAAVAALSLLLAPAAHGHAFLEHAEPRVGSTVGSPPSSLTLRFTEGVEAAFSKVEVTDATGKRIETGPLEHPESNVIAVSLPGLAPGLLCRHGDTPLAQDDLGLLHVAAGLRQRRAAVQHARTGLIAQLLDCCR